MQKSMSSLLLSKSIGRSVSRRFGGYSSGYRPAPYPNPNPNSHSNPIPNWLREQDNIRHFNPDPNSWLRQRGKDGTQLPSCGLRSYATMRESSQQAIGDRRQALQKKSQATLMYLVALVIAMVGCSYAAVPLYRKFCQATGFGGTVRRRETVEEKIARHAQDASTATRQLVVQFNADIGDGLPWKFTPTQREVRVKPGQSTLAFFTAENLSSKPITGVSTYNVTPMKAGVYFNKIQCFCFEEQRLLPGEKIDMPVFFYIDPEFATDPKMDNVNNLILSYTFFRVEDEEESNTDSKN